MSVRFSTKHLSNRWTVQVFRKGKGNYYDSFYKNYYCKTHEKAELLTKKINSSNKFTAGHYRADYDNV